MKNNKVLKFGIALISTVVLGAVAPALTNNPVFGASVVKAEETRPLEYRIVYYDKDTREEIAPPKTGTINPGEIVNIYKDIDGYQVVSNFDEWMPGFNASYRIMSEYFGFSNGRLFMYLDYKRLTPTPDPAPTPNPAPTPDPGQGQDQNPTPNPAPTPDPGQGQDQNPTPNPAPTPDPGQGQDQNPTPKKPDQGQQSTEQLPETGEKDSVATTLLGLLVAALAWFTLLRKKNN